MIEGVAVTELTTHEDKRGFFREIFRFSEKFGGIPLAQLSHSMVNEGAVKGWHGHVNQFQWNYVVSGQIQLALYDNREDSATYREPLELVSGDGSAPIAYFFPPGVLHGYKCTQGPLHIIYLTSGIYDLEDEVRIELNNKNIGFNPF